jgi:acyl-CoA thioesterase FadM
VERLGGKSFTVRHRFLDADGVQKLASGRETRVWCRYEAGPGTPLRGEALPDDLRARLAGQP